MRRAKRIIYQTWFFGLILLVTALFAYALRIGQMGYYWDDWEGVFLHHLNMPDPFQIYFQFDRPFSVWFFDLFFPLIGYHPAIWQIFSILMRWLVCLFFWLLLRTIWPNRERQVRWMALLLLVYPGFTQQGVSVTYSRHFLSYALLMLSFVFMAWSVLRPRKAILFTCLGLLSTLVHMTIVEYFIGLELLRPLILWFLLHSAGQSLGATLKKTFIRWLPYLLLLFVFFLVRFVFFDRFSVDPGTNAPGLLFGILQDPVREGVRLTQYILQDMLHLVLFSWLTLKPADIDLFARFQLFSLAFGALVAAGIVVYMKLTTRPVEEPGTDRFVAQCIPLGLAAILFGGMPIWGTGRQIIGAPWFDRYSLAPMLGVVILLVALIEWFGHSPLRRSIFAAVLFVFAFAFQMQLNNQYKIGWDNQRSFYWQLYWRAPALKAPTLVVSEFLPLPLVTEIHYTLALNTIYAPDQPSPQSPLWFIKGGSHKGKLFPNYEPDHNVQMAFRNITFEGSTSNAIVISDTTGPACLRVLRPQDVNKTSAERQMSQISNLDQILPTGDSGPVEKIFGPEPAREWCYYFQKADLARQNGLWVDVINIWDDAEEHGFSPLSYYEFGPFIEAYLVLGEIEKAQILTESAVTMDANSTPYFCNLWMMTDRLRPAGGEQAQILDWAEESLGCKGDMDAQ